MAGSDSDSIDGAIGSCSGSVADKLSQDTTLISFWN